MCQAPGKQDPLPGGHRASVSGAGGGKPTLLSSPHQWGSLLQLCEGPSPTSTPGWVCPIICSDITSSRVSPLASQLRTPTVCGPLVPPVILGGRKKNHSIRAARVWHCEGAQLFGETYSLRRSTRRERNTPLTCGLSSRRLQAALLVPRVKRGM